MDARQNHPLFIYPFGWIRMVIEPPSTAATGYPNNRVYSQDTLAFSMQTGIRAMVEEFPLERPKARHYSVEKYRGIVNLAPCYQTLTWRQERRFTGTMWGRLR